MRISDWSSDVCSSDLLDPRLLDALDPIGIGHVGRVVELDGALAGAILRSGEVDVVDDARRGGDEIEIIFAGQALLDDLEVEEAEEAAAKAEAQGGRGLHLEAEARIVEAELGDGVAELLEIGGVDREEAAEANRLDKLEARQGVRGGLPHGGERVADPGQIRRAACRRGGGRKG